LAQVAKPEKATHSLVPGGSLQRQQASVVGRVRPVRGVSGGRAV
jgi:hypothetical protein